MSNWAALWTAGGIVIVVLPIFLAAQLAKSRDGRIGSAMLWALLFSWIGLAFYAVTSRRTRAR